ncbi:MAG: hypothetical protein JWN43_3111 [Gammaproteobacteria bacterium]|nr:hypothetical protein [Gammaproteobacteria bacterium]
MTPLRRLIRSRLWFTICAVGALVVPWSVVHAGKTIHEHVSVDAQGSIEIVNVAGSVDLSGWDRSEIDVTGTSGDNIERVDVTTNGTHSSVHVVSRSGSSWGGANEAHLTIHVPGKSAITATLVSADLKLKNLQGQVKVQTVSGDVSGAVGGDLQATTVSGGVHLKAPAANVIEVKTISGDIQISGGGGEVEITTISGDAQVELAALKRGRFKSVSGDLTAVFTLAAEGQIDAESVSGGQRFEFASVPAADFDVQSFSGDIRNCFGPKPLQSRYGPGSRLAFKTGDGKGRVRIETKSGDVHLCTKDLRGDRAAAPPTAQLCEPHPAKRDGAGDVGVGARTRFLPLL